MSLPILWYLDSNEISSRQFERLCADLLSRENFPDIVPIGGTNDQGRDAELVVWKDTTRSVVAFQFTLEKRWEAKLKKDRDKIRRLCPDAGRLIFVTSQSVTGAKRDALALETKAECGFDLQIFDREWLRLMLEERHPDLANRYFGLDLPQASRTVSALAYSCDIEVLPKEASGPTPHVDRATLTAAIQKSPQDLKSWKLLAQLEFNLRNYQAALEAVIHALSLDGDNIDLVLLRAGILAEMGIKHRSRPLLVEAKDIYAGAVTRLNRWVDHYNLANVLGELDELAEAEEHYRECLKLKPDNARAWKNLGSLLIKQTAYPEGFSCFDKALEIRPDLLEGHLSKATALLLFRGDAAGAIHHFRIAYELDPHLDQKWDGPCYWYSQALQKAGEFESALQIVERELIRRPGNRHLLDQKAFLLSELWRKDGAYVPQAIQFFSFRTKAVLGDVLSLGELIDLSAVQPLSESFWSLMDGSCRGGAVAVSLLAERAKISPSMLRNGFTIEAFSAYRKMRKKFSVDDYLSHFREAGFHPTDELKSSLDPLLIGLFGDVFYELKTASEGNPTVIIQAKFGELLDVVCRLFAACGGYWLGTRPSTREEVPDLLAKAMASLGDVVLVEVSRQVAYAAGTHSLSPEQVAEMGTNRNLSGAYGEAGALLLEQLGREWGEFSSLPSAKESARE